VSDPIAPAGTGIVLNVQAVDLVRGDRLLLDEIAFTVRAGEHWALLGPNGAGKSTLLRILITYAHPTRGRVDILGYRLGRVTVFSLGRLAGARWPLLSHGERSHTLIARALMTEPPLLLRGGRAVAAGPVADVLTTKQVSTCFDYPIAIARHAGRWTRSPARPAGPDPRCLQPRREREGQHWRLAQGESGALILRRRIRCPPGRPGQSS
jgi:ABC transporter